LTHKNHILKKALAIFFLLLFLFNSLGYFIVFRLNQLEIRDQMHSELLQKTPNSSLTCITLSAKNTTHLDWTEENEFVYQGSRYDVVRTEKKADGSVSYFCMNDSKEDELFSQLDQNLGNQLDANKMNTGKTGKLILKLLSFDYVSTFEKTTFHFTAQNLTPRAFIPGQSVFYYEITTPPPRTA